MMMIKCEWIVQSVWFTTRSSGVTKEKKEKMHVIYLKMKWSISLFFFSSFLWIIRTVNIIDCNQALDYRVQVSMTNIIIFTTGVCHHWPILCMISKIGDKSKNTTISLNLSMRALIKFIYCFIWWMKKMFIWCIRLRRFMSVNILNWKKEKWTK